MSQKTINPFSGGPMKRISFVIAFFTLISLSVFAAFCTQCGGKNPDGAKFCAHCGTAQKAVPGTKTSTPEPKKPVVTPPAPLPPAGKPSSEGTFRTKTDLYVYEKRGDERNVLKKNFLFKPKRYRIQANSQIKIMETVGESFLVQSLPDSSGKVYQGWVLESELALRTEWTKTP